ncbi:hypothetical protein Tco_0674068 [Tanacetum coccineum]
MGDDNPICTLGDYSKPSHKGYRNTIELPAGNNVVPLRSDTIRSINAITIHIEQQSASYDDGEKENKEEEDYPENIHINPPTPPDLSITFITEKVLKFNSFFESLGLVPPSSNTKLICIQREMGLMFDDNCPKG